jgi:hypothetical protein
MALASMPAGLTDSEWKGRLFLRFYSHDFSAVFISEVWLLLKWFRSSGDTK